MTSWGQTVHRSYPDIVPSDDELDEYLITPDGAPEVLNQPVVEAEGSSKLHFTDSAAVEFEDRLFAASGVVFLAFV